MKKITYSTFQLIDSSVEKMIRFDIYMKIVFENY